MLPRNPTRTVTRPARGGGHKTTTLVMHNGAWRSSTDVARSMLGQDKSGKSKVGMGGDRGGWRGEKRDSHGKWTD